MVEALDALFEMEEGVAWRLSLAIIPEPHSVSTPTSKPDWRDWAAEAPTPVTWAVLWATTVEVVERLLANVKSDASRWSELLDKLPSLQQEAQNRILARLEQLGPQEFGPEALGTVQGQIRKLIAHHRSFPNADWAMPSSTLDRLDALYLRFEPNDLRQRSAWLFTDHPELTDVRMGDWDARDARLATLRSEAIKQIFDDGGLPSVISFAHEVDQPFFVGFTLGKTVAELDEPTLLVNGLASDDMPLRGFTRGLVSAWLNLHGDPWIERLVSGSAWGALSPDQKAEILLMLPPCRKTWDYIQADEQTQSVYWRSVHPFFRDDLELGIRYLLRFRRPYAAIGNLAFARDLKNSHDLVPLVTDAMEAAMTSTPDQEPKDWSSLSHGLAELLNYLASSGAVEPRQLATYEWYFLPLLSHARRPATLHAELSENPQFFVDLLTLVFKPRHGEPAAYSEDAAARAESAYELLHSWRSIPGRQEQTIDGDALNSWFDRARELYSAVDRAEIGDHMVGQMLSAAPSDPDGPWPAEPVRRLIERVRSDDLEQGFEIGLFNSRGVTSRGIGDGGQQEWSLAQEYNNRAAALETRWPRTAAMVRRIADNYAGLARHEDTRAELEEDLLE
jgi:hypothetical protein